jgi:hypothetical protein
MPAVSAETVTVGGEPTMRVQLINTRGTPNSRVPAAKVSGQLLSCRATHEFGTEMAAAP